MANRWYTQFYGSLHKKPVQLDCNFVVDPANGNGLGIRSLKGPGIGNVYMHTTASFVGSTHSNTVVDGIASTSSLLPGMPISGSGIAAGTVISSITSSTAIVINPGASTSVAGGTITYVGVGSPNPAAGLIFVNLQDNFNRYFFGTAGLVSPLSGSNISISTPASLTVGAAYVIVSVGSSTTANWVSVGLPIGITPAVGVSFIASATSGSGSGIVQAPGASGIMSVEVVGDPNQTISSSAATIMGVSSGSYMIVQCLNSSSALTAPAVGSVMGLSFFLSNSSIMVQGE